MDSVATVADLSYLKNNKPQVLTSGCFELHNSGLINASVRLIRLYIGEPGRFIIPITLYSAVSSNSFQNPYMPVQSSNEQLFVNLINPHSGLLHLSTDGHGSSQRKRERLTNMGFLYQAGVRLLSGYVNGSLFSPSMNSPVNFINYLSVVGLYFQTAAWEKGNTKNLGLFWLSGRYIISRTAEKELQRIYPAIQTNGVYHGWSFAWGIDISETLDMKVIHYQYFKPPSFSSPYPIFLFSFNYALN